MTQTNNTKLKEELWEYYHTHELDMNSFMDYIIKKAREGYVRKEDFEEYKHHYPKDIFKS